MGSKIIIKLPTLVIINLSLLLFLSTGQKYNLLVQLTNVIAINFSVQIPEQFAAVRRKWLFDYDSNDKTTKNEANFIVNLMLQHID